MASTNVGSKVERSPGVWRPRVTPGYDPITNKPTQKSKTFRGTEHQADTELARFAATATIDEDMDAISTLGEVID